MSQEKISMKPVSDKQTQRDELTTHSVDNDIVEDYNIIELDDGPECSYVGDSDYEDYNHKMRGFDVEFTRDVNVVNSVSAGSATSALLVLAGISSSAVTIGAGAIVGLWVGLSGPRYYYGIMDRDRGCVSGRCGFRTIDNRYGDGSTANPDDWDQFYNLTSVNDYSLGHIGSP
ncbi:hypothetical protein G6M89_04835 [Natronolimnobius sp. AArcel1]|uniref:hypothetical protein n=1 Tax=Natronolimnobius sp. AArcel1 TaxID=1679093 RepID=UPI0013EA2D5C|nr:hypothetical protein [Natronolimnobius sp. AArcel1]NGM68341.1 hypothetical protein [Natronolimnobius sp. AArcel1]